MIKLLYILRCLLAPIVILLSQIIPVLRKRSQFERLNLKQEYPQWRVDGERADYAFEVSSEGELEQVLPLIQFYLDEFKRVELLYCSDSVEGKVQALFAKNKKLLAIYRLPLVNFCLFSKKCNPQNWITAKQFYFCRYDFFPELVYRLERFDRVYLLNAATSDDIKSFSLKNIFYRKVYKSMHVIVCASLSEVSKFEQIIVNQKLLCLDFRIIQINKRLEKSYKSLEEKIVNLKSLEALFDQYAYEDRIILGSMWPEEFEIFKNTEMLNGKLIFIAPHKLSDHFILEIKSRAQQKFGASVTIFDGKNKLEVTRPEKGPLVIICSAKGVLCELYQFFGHSYIAGGFGRSIHSVMEPFLAGSKVYCGPKVHRSTEFSLIREATGHRWPIIVEDQFSLDQDDEYLKINDLKNQLIEQQLLSMNKFQDEYAR